MWCESNRRQKYMVENFDGNVFIFLVAVLVMLGGSENACAE